MSAALVAIRADIEENGDIITLINSGNPAEQKIHAETVKRDKALSPQPDSVIDARFRRTNDLISSLAQRIEATTMAKMETVPLKSVSRVAGAVGLGFSEGFLQRAARISLPKPTYECTDEYGILNAVKGWLCYWMKLNEPSVSINGTTVDGTVRLDAGAAVHACVRKFWGSVEESVGKRCL